MEDPEAHRVAHRDLWEAVAAGWERDAGAPFFAATLPVAHWMVDRLAPQPGETILELAAGRGDVGFLAAELLHPGGRLISTDGAEAMVAIARRRGEALGLRDVEYKPMELEWLDAKLASIDGILCRFGYMHAVDPEAALREARRVLRPGGRLVLTVWDVPAANPWLAAAPEAAAALGHPVPGSQPGSPGAFALSAPGALEELLADAGFDDIAIEPLDLAFTGTLDALWDALRELSSTVRPVLDALSPADHYRLRDAVEERWARHAAPDGTVTLPARVLGAVAQA